MSYEGSVLHGIQTAVARAMIGYLPASSQAFTFRLGQPDDAATSTEACVIWTQPEDGRYQYEEPWQPEPVQDADAEQWQNAQRGEAILSRYMAVDVLIRTPGSERRLLELSDAFHCAMKDELGAPGNQGQAWRHEGRSDGAGGGMSDATWEERFRIYVRYSVVNQRFVEGGPLEVVTGEAAEAEGSGLLIEGPAQGENTEQVL